MSKVFIEETTLSAIGDAIREKAGTSDLINPLDMPEAIASITTGGGEEFEIPIFTGSFEYRFFDDNWTWFINYYQDKIKTANVTACRYAFQDSATLEEIPFEINCVTTKNISIANMFRYCNALKTVPKINNIHISDTENVFRACYNLREIPEDYTANWDWSAIDTTTSKYAINQKEMFNSCYSLRKIPKTFFQHINTYSDPSYAIYSAGFQYCYVLDEIIDLPVYTNATWTSNTFGSTFNSCHRLKNITFAVQEDGTPYTVQWKNQTINLSQYIGYQEALISEPYGNITKYNSGITSDKAVWSAEDYQRLKDDPDWFVAMHYPQFSRYNHDSAVATINSLPDASAYLATAGGTNTIKFKGESGSATDGGAINTLTQEEIAVATAKGWTVTLV